jgi:energy-coupling factor transporter ATP-binding protein EcfA2
VNGTALLSVEAAAFRYAGGAVPIGPFDLEVHPGEMHLVRGLSGCGKSTLARMLCGAIPHLYRGHLDGGLRVDGRPSGRTPLWELARTVGLVSQNPGAQLLACSARDEIAFGLENLGLRGAELEERLDAALRRFGLGNLGRRDPRTLSGGEQQKLVLAAVTARRPRALVADEPLSMLDAASAAEVVRHFEQLRAEGTAVVAFEHRATPFRKTDGVRVTELRAAHPVDRPLPELGGDVPAFRLVGEAVRVDLGGRSVLRDVQLRLDGGEVVGIVGANGAGKTTLLRALAGLQKHGGRIASTAGRRLGLGFQNPDCQIFNPTVRQEILYGHATPDEEHYRRVVDLLGLAPYESTPPLLLSEGEKKRLGLAILLMRTELAGLCLDEPTLGQDEGHRRLIGRVLRRLAGRGRLCVVATHDLAWAGEWTDRVLLLQDGRSTSVDRPARPDPPRRSIGAFPIPDEACLAQSQS